jgi:hypothetical protein
MSNQPQFYNVSGGLQSDLVYRTNVQAHFLYGTLPPDTEEIVLKIDESTIKSEDLNTYIWWDTTDPANPKFTFPNINTMPEGYILTPREKPLIVSIASKANGNTSQFATATTSVISTDTIDNSYDRPTGVSVERYQDQIALRWSSADSQNLVGYNVYGSVGTGGAGFGYLRLNRDIITKEKSYENVEEYTNLGSEEYSFNTPGATNTGRVRIDAIDSLTREPSSAGVGVLKEFDLIGFDRFKATYSFQAVRVTRKYEFIHNRTFGVARGVLNQDVFSFISNNNPVYYVVTAVYKDSQTQDIYESAYSEELVGLPLPAATDVRGLSIRSDGQVVTDYLVELQKVAPTLSVIPGSTVREIHIEPFANEIQKAYFYMDFVHRAGSFNALLNIDDPDKTGISVSVASSSYKTALKSSLGFSDDVSVQEMINKAFDNLASNYGETRRGFKAATVLQTFYTNDRPVRDLFIMPTTTVRASSSPGSPRFLTSGLTTMRLSQIDSYYNPSKRRYEVKVQMNAEFGGTTGNVPAGALNTIENGVGWKTENEFAATGGTDPASNLELSEMCLRKLSGVDSGTEGGYEATVRSVPNVQDFKVVSAGSPYMHRDFDPASGEHVGGKVDIYVKGSVTRSIRERYAFSYNVVESERFVILNRNENGIVLMSLDNSLSPSNPIDRMISLKKRDSGQNIPLGVVGYLGYNQVEINGGGFDQIPADTFIVGSYRYRTKNAFELNVQPVDSVLSIEGEVSGQLNENTGYKLFEWQDPTIDGYGTSSSEYVEVFQEDGIPTGDFIFNNGDPEEHVLIGEIEEPLNNIGVEIDTIRVYILVGNNQETEYTLGDDYRVVPGDNETPTKIVRINNGAIENGLSVLVEYARRENFTVSYNVNDLVRRVQEAVDLKKHATADVVVKQAVENPLNVSAVVQLKPNAKPEDVDRDIRTSYSRMVGLKGIGEDIHISDVIAAIDNTKGVDFVVQPFGLMTLRDGAMRVREQITNTYTYVPQLADGRTAVYMLNEPLEYSTVTNGGDENIFHGVFQDEKLLNLIKDDVALLQENADSAFIAGRYGVVIKGLSDDDTISAKLGGSPTAQEIQAERERMTANRVFLSLSGNSNYTPSDFEYTVTYQVYGDKSVKDVYVSDIEYLSPGDLTITYRTA